MTTSRGSDRIALPLEIILAILEVSAGSSSTKHARNVCLVSKAAYNLCWPYLYRIVALRNATQLKAFSEDIYHPEIAAHGENQESSRLRKRQDALEFLYLNNNKDTSGIRELQTDERPEMWMISILLAARNLKTMHIEEYWSVSYPWESQEEKPLLAYPLMLLSSFPEALHAAFVASPKSEWVHRLFSNRQAPTTDIFEDIITLQIGESSKRQDCANIIPQPHEVTLSALAMSTSHLTPSKQASSLSFKLAPNFDAFEHLNRLHLYFAKMDVLLVETLLNFGRLTHLRLTRPFSEKLSDAVFRLLGGESEESRIKCLIVEAGVYMDDRTVTRLREMQVSPLGKGRLHLIDNVMYQHGPHKPPEVEIVDGAEEAGRRDSCDGSSSSNDAINSSAKVINWVSNTEERGFAQFSERAWGEEGIWSV
ncbi:hypothetical protein CBS101457_006839 [Exobasidium rhododendri]|nr:hypothetical protein CBS101457_006839 [Exobasidium rhododendri]